MCFAGPRFGTLLHTEAHVDSIVPGQRCVILACHDPAADRPQACDHQLARSLRTPGILEAVKTARKNGRLGLPGPPVRGWECG